MNTAEDLKQEFKARYVKLNEVTEVYFEWTENYTRDQAAKGLIPFPIFKAVDSPKAPWLADVIDVADWLEKRRLGA